MISRRQMLNAAALALGGAGATSLLRGLPVLPAAADPGPADSKSFDDPSPRAGRGRYTPVVTPNGQKLPWKWEGSYKAFHLVAEPVKREFAPGLVVNCWGYNGQTPGPTIEAQ